MKTASARVSFVARRWCGFAGLVLPALAALWAPGALALPVSIEPNGYAGRWALANTWYSGSQVLDLSPGAYQLSIGGAEGTGFTVARDGTVTVTNPVATEGGAAWLRFRTAPVRIEPYDYAGHWYVAASTPELLHGPHTLALVPGLRYRLGIGGWGGFMFSVKADGTVSTQATSSASVSGNTLTLKTVSVVINTRDYSGFWSLDAAARQTWQHTQFLRLVPGVQYRLLIGSRGGFPFTVEADGTVSTQATASASVWRNTLVLNTVPVRLAPSDPARAWTVSAAVAPAPTEESGTRTLKLVPGLLYQLRLRGPSAYDFFTLGETGTPSPASLVVGGTRFELSCNP